MRFREATAWRVKHDPDSGCDDSCCGCARDGGLVHDDRIQSDAIQLEEGELNWAKLCFGNSEVMLDTGGKASTEHRREVHLYVTTDNVDELYQRLKDRVQVVQDLYNSFYGMREFIIRDCNGFWITFGQPIQE